MGGGSFSGIWWSFVFGVRCWWRHNLTSYSCFQTSCLANFVHIICTFFYIHSPYFICHCTEYSGIQWHMVVICIWCALFVTLQFDVIFMFPNELFGEFCSHNMHIFLHPLPLFYTSLHWIQRHSVAYGGHLYLVCAVCDVTIWRHIHVSKRAVWRSLLT